MLSPNASTFTVTVPSTVTAWAAMRSCTLLPMRSFSLLPVASVSGHDTVNVPVVSMDPAPSVPFTVTDATFTVPVPASVAVLSTVIVAVGLPVATHELFM